MQQEEINIVWRILEDLYHGNLTANGQTFRHGTKYPFVRPAFDVRKDEAYQIMKNVLKDELLK